MKTAQDLYTGGGYHTTWLEPMAQAAKLQVDTELAQITHEWQASEHCCTSSALEHALATWQDYNRMVVRSWDLMAALDASGTVVRFEHTQTHARTQDWFVRLQQQAAQRLKPNMARLQEEIDCALIALDSYTVGGIQRWTATTTSGDVQISVTKIGHEFYYGWLCLADQIFFSIENTWQDQSQSTRPGPRPAIVVTQTTRTSYTTAEALQHQRTREHTHICKGKHND